MTTPTVDVNQFNNFIAKANDMLTCDSKCQEAKKSEELKQKYLESKTNLITAPNQVDTSYKNYLTFTKGQLAYDDYQEKQLEASAKKITETILLKFQEEREKGHILLETYAGLMANYSHVGEFYERLRKENAMLNVQLKDTSSDVLTNDRKTFYEDQKIDSIYFYYKLFLIIYIIAVLVLIGFLINSGRDSLGKKIMIILFFSLYPFFVNIIFFYVYRLYDIIVSLLPKNVYKTI